MSSKVVVFDVGGVLLDWNPRYLYRKLLDHDEDIDSFFADVGFADWNVQQDAGRSWKDGVAELCARFPGQRSLIEAADVRWQEMVAGAIDGTVDILRELQAQGTPLYAITNFSSEKWTEVCDRFSFLKIFRDVVVSGDEKVIKPDHEIFHRLVIRNQLRVDDCLFIDDSAQNVAASRQVGMIGVLFESPERLRLDLRDHGLL